jgi:glutathione S-transferase
MLELYHGGHTTCSRKARLGLKEKGLAYKSHFLNLRGFEQHAPDYVALNPNGVVPTLIDDGQPVVDSMLINEYLDEKFDSMPRLRPTNPLDKARMRVWTKLASDYGLAAVVPRIWPTFKANTDKLSASELEQMISRVPLKERRDRWTKVVQAGFGEADNKAGLDAARLIIGKMEAGLGNGPWLMGEQYTLADIDLVPFVDRIAEFYTDTVNVALTPRTVGWLARMRTRPAVMAVWATDEASESKAA